MNIDNVFWIYLNFSSVLENLCSLLLSWVRLKCGYGTELMRNGTDMGLKRGTERIWG
jgi:hypothetical protein